MANKDGEEMDVLSFLEDDKLNPLTGKPWSVDSFAAGAPLTDEEKREIEEILLGILTGNEPSELGGPGSGYDRPHYGRPGERGGSRPRSAPVAVGNVDVSVQDEWVKLDEVPDGWKRADWPEYRGKDRLNESIFRVDGNAQEIMNHTGLLLVATRDVEPYNSKGEILFGSRFYGVHEHVLTSVYPPFPYGGDNIAYQLSQYVHFDVIEMGGENKLFATLDYAAVDLFKLTRWSEQERVEWEMGQLYKAADILRSKGMSEGTVIHVVKKVMVGNTYVSQPYTEIELSAAAELGGPGSGYGKPHRGRPGQVGGSLPRDAAGVIVVGNIGSATEIPGWKIVGIAPSNQDHPSSPVYQMLENGEHVLGMEWARVAVAFRGPHKGAILVSPTTGAHKSVIHNEMISIAFDDDTIDNYVRYMVRYKDGVPYFVADFRYAGEVYSSDTHDQVIEHIHKANSSLRYRGVPETTRLEIWDNVPQKKNLWYDTTLEFALGELGGPGSGYSKPHKGRPGKVGGSLPREYGGDGYKLLGYSNYGREIYLVTKNAKYILEKAFGRLEGKTYPTGIAVAIRGPHKGAVLVSLNVEHQELIEALDEEDTIDNYVRFAVAPQRARSGPAHIVTSTAYATVSHVYDNDAEAKAIDAIYKGADKLIAVGMPKKTPLEIITRDYSSLDVVLGGDFSLWLRQLDELGGPGSGYFAPKHHGRPGQVGGSQPSDESKKLSPSDGDEYNVPTIVEHHEQADALDRNLTSSQTDAMEWYSGQGAWMVNWKLKRGETHQINSYDQGMMEILDTVFVEPDAKAKENLQVLRGTIIKPTNPDSAEILSMLRAKAVNPDMPLRYESNGYLSTTCNPKVASNFAKPFNQEFRNGLFGIQWYIQIPKGTGMAAVKRYDEAEYILPRNTRIRIYKVIETSENLFSVHGSVIHEQD